MQLTVNLPEEIGGRIRRLRDPDRFVAEALIRALPGSSVGEQPLRASIGDLSQKERQRWATKMRSTFELEGEALPIEKIQDLSCDSDLADNELSHGIVQAREE
jgi:hypothetical protein